jgi:hypothetical protein
MNNFDTLNDAVQAHGGNQEAAMADQNALWTALLQLPEWHLLFSPQLQQPSPQVVTVDGKRWVLVFTDPDRLQKYAQENDLVVDGDKALYTSLSVPDARKTLQSMTSSGIYGVRFNQGAHGWYSPISSIKAIHSFLVNNGSITASKEPTKAAEVPPFILQATPAEKEQFSLWLTLAYLSVAASDQSLDDREHAIWRDIIVRWQLPDLWAKDTKAILKRFQSGELSQLSEALSSRPEAQRQVLYEAIEPVASADGVVETAEKAALMVLQAELGLTQPSPPVKAVARHLAPRLPHRSTK